jgi:hypothetical protein
MLLNVGWTIFEHVDDDVGSFCNIFLHAKSPPDAYLNNLFQAQILWASESGEMNASQDEPLERVMTAN